MQFISYSSGDSMRCKVGPGVHFDPHFWGRGGRSLIRVSDSAIRKSDDFLYRLSIVTTALSLTIRPQFAIECLQCSNQRRWDTLGQNLWRKGWTDVSQILTQSRRYMGAVVLTSSAVWAECMNVTYRQTDHETVTSIPVGEIAFSDAA